MNKLLLNSITGISTLMIANIINVNYEVTLALTNEEINNMAKETVVAITGTNQASGVIISKKENTYGVLTTWENVKKEGDYKVLTTDGKSYPVINKKEIPGADLAIIYFDSEANYKLARFGNSNQINERDSFYLAGYSSSSPDQEKPQYRFYERKLVEIKANANASEGYQFISEGTGLPGMNGSAILNDDGRLIGLYGKTEINPETLESNLLAIPLHTIENLANLAEIDLKRPASNITVQETSADPKLISQTTQIDYNPLRNLLAAEKWQEADQTTLNLMLTAVNRENEGWFIKENIEQFPCNDLKIIDNLWSEYSGNRFGLKIQGEIYLETGNRLENYDLVSFRNFGENIGWRENGQWLSKDELIYNENAPIGHLPVSLPKRLGVYLGPVLASCQL